MVGLVTLGDGTSKQEEKSSNVDPENYLSQLFFLTSSFSFSPPLAVECMESTVEDLISIQKALVNTLSPGALVKKGKKCYKADFLRIVMVYLI